jgi:hypothetical protein
VLVTDSWFCAHGKRFAIDELTDLTWCVGPVQTGRWIALKVVALGAVLVAGIEAVVGTSTIAVLGAMGYFLGAGIVLWISLRRWPTPLNLWATYRGIPTVVYTSTDRIEFQKVYRALRRAAELQERAQ